MSKGLYAFISLALMLAAGIWVQWVQDPGRSAKRSTSDPAQRHASLSIGWMPDWLSEPIQKAIFDAHDPRDRKPQR